MKEEKKTEKQERCFCPYCEEELVMANLPYCRPCRIVFLRCIRCNITVLDRKATKCPQCGEPLTKGGKK